MNVLAAEDITALQASFDTLMVPGMCRLFVVKPYPNADGCYEALGTVERDAAHPALGQWCPRDMQFHWSDEAHSCPPLLSDYIQAHCLAWVLVKSPKFQTFLDFCVRQARAAAYAADAAGATAYATAYAAGAAAYAADAAGATAYATAYAADAAAYAAADAAARDDQVQEIIRLEALP
jgi:hypothetical protein